MLTLLRDLVAHNGHANAAMLGSVRRCEAGVADPEILEFLHHVLLAHRFGLLAILDQPFAMDTESRRATSFEELVRRYRLTHEQQTACLHAATDADLARILESDLIPGRQCTIAQALMQVCQHSHGHRAQAATLLRRHDGTPPVLDFIVRLVERPTADWEGATGRA